MTNRAVNYPDTTAEISPDGTVYWRGKEIGRVFKGTRTYSPPTHKGSRIVKYHKQVPCWYAEPSPGAQREMDTQRLAIRFLIDRKQRETQ
jgi:hypothetical protein